MCSPSRSSDRLLSILTRLSHCTVLVYIKPLVHPPYLQLPSLSSFLPPLDYSLSLSLWQVAVEDEAKLYGLLSVKLEAQLVPPDCLILAHMLPLSVSRGPALVAVATPLKFIRTIMKLPYPKGSSIITMVCPFSIFRYESNTLTWRSLFVVGRYR